MNISWGTKIALLYISFVVMIISLVAASSRKKVDLVSDNYYQQEVDFQQRIDAEQARAGLRDSVTLEAAPNYITLVFPQTFRTKKLTADIHFYAIANGDADKSFVLTTTDGKLSIDRYKLARVPYEVQVSWKVDGIAYYQAIPLNLR